MTAIAERPATGPGTPAPAETGLDLVVAGRAEAADRVAVLDLREAGGSALPGWAPGAHIELLLGPGLIRQYSLCGDPADSSRWRIAVLREPGGRGGSELVHTGLADGAPVRARGPRNHFPLLPAGRYLFIAGGIGITPILPMLAAASASGADWTLAYGGRSTRSMPFAGDLRARHGERVRLWPQDERGLIDLDTLLGAPMPGTLIYCCGPEPLLAAVEARCAAWPAGSLQVERFTPRPDTADGRTAFEVELASSGRVLTVPAEASILSVLEGAGVPALSSCTEGTCGTCETGVLAGVPDHRDSVLTPAERDAADVMMICVSRARSTRLVLDL